MFPLGSLEQTPLGGLPVQRNPTSPSNRLLSGSETSLRLPSCLSQNAAAVEVGSGVGLEQLAVYGVWSHTKAFGAPALTWSESLFRGPPEESGDGGHSVKKVGLESQYGSLREPAALHHRNRCS